MKRIAIGILGLFLVVGSVGCVSFFPNRGITAKDMRVLLSLRTIYKEADQLRNSPAWQNTASITSQVVHRDWRKLEKVMKRLVPHTRYSRGGLMRRSYGLNKRSRDKIKAYLQGYYDELGERIEILLSRRQFALAKAAANALPSKSPKRKETYRAVSRELERLAKKHLRRYPGLATYYLHAAATLLDSKRQGKRRELFQQASQLASRLRSSYALPVQLQISGSLNQRIRRGLTGLIRKRKDAKLARGGAILRLRVSRPMFRRSTRSGSRSQRYRSGYRMVVSRDYKDTQREVRIYRGKVNHSQDQCRRHGSRNSWCRGLGYNRRKLSFYQKRLSKTRRMVRQAIYSNYRYSTTIKVLRTISSVNAALQPRRGRRFQRNERVSSEVTHTGHGRHPTIRLSFKRAVPPSESRGNNALGGTIAGFANKKLLSGYLASLGRRIQRSVRRQRDLGGIDACVTYLLRFPTAYKSDRQAIWKHLRHLSKLDHKRLP